MILTLMYNPLSALRRLDVPLLAFWATYLSVWPGVLFWWSRL